MDLFFKEWVSRFDKEESDHGIFARWFRGNYSGRMIQTRKGFLIKMRCNNTPHFLMSQFEELWAEFELIPNARTKAKTIKVEIHRY